MLNLQNDQFDNLADIKHQSFMSNFRKNGKFGNVAKLWVLFICKSF